MGGCIASPRAGVGGSNSPSAWGIGMPPIGGIGIPAIGGIGIPPIGIGAARGIPPMGLMPHGEQPQVMHPHPGIGIAVTGMA
jgi:hypothetical protein